MSARYAAVILGLTLTCLDCDGLPVILVPLAPVVVYSVICKGYQNRCILQSCCC